METDAMNSKLPKGWRVITGKLSRRQKRALPKVVELRRSDDDLPPPLPPFGIVYGTGRRRGNDLPSDKRGA
jgi:hypothetical protein